MDIISRISKGTKMDQIYIPKNRSSLEIGSYVIIKPLETIPENNQKPYFYNIKTLEPIKIDIINSIFKIISESLKKEDNIIITGSFLYYGFKFDDVDVLIVTEKKINENLIKKELEDRIGIIPHIITIKVKELISGLSSDPLYQMMLSSCVSKRKFIYKYNKKINYKLLDLHLLKSKPLIDNFYYLDSNQIYGLTRNLITISLFLKDKKLSNDLVNLKIKEEFNLKNIDEIKKGIINKGTFLKKYKFLYEKTFKIILNNVKNHSIK